MNCSFYYLKFRQITCNNLTDNKILLINHFIEFSMVASCPTHSVYSGMLICMLLVQNTGEDFFKSLA